VTTGPAAAGAVTTGADRPETVHVWLIRQDLPPPVLAELAAALDTSERARAARAERVGADHGRRFAAAHGAARLILGRHLRIAAHQVRWRTGPNGKPELADADAGVHVSLSHSGDLAALAILDARRVGIDVQVFPTRSHAIRVAERFFPAAEARFVVDAAPAAQARRFTRLWARKEACVKVTGGRLLQGLRLPVGATGRAVVHDPWGPLPGPYLVQDVPGPRRFGIAVAAEGTAPYRVLRHWWPDAGFTSAQIGS